MSEAEWLACTDPQKMLEFLRGRFIARKLRLFGIACCRQLWHLLPDNRSRQTVDLAEATADDRDTRTLLQESLVSAREVVEEILGPLTGLRAELESLLTDDRAACLLVFFLAWRTEQEAFHDTSAIIRYTAGRLSADGKQFLLADHIHDIFGNPFRPIAIGSVCLTWQDSLIVSMARQMYESRDFRDMPVLADALEEAGCTDQNILDHCRQPGEHVRGCWVVDMFLGKE